MVKNDYLERVLKARVYDVAIESPLELAASLSKRLGNRLFIKREDLQPVFSFKLRGAYNKMAGLPRKRLQRGVIAASAGNHAQGVALAAKRLGCRAIIVMPVTTPRIKVEAVAARGAQVVLHGDSYADAYTKAVELKKKRGLVFVHPYDDPEVIAGQGTIGMEILRQQPNPDAIFVPVGGGGLISGIAAYVKRVRPSVKVIGVEPVDADAMTRSLKKGRRVRLEQVGLFADGVAVKEVGKETFRLCRRFVDDMVLVDTDEMCAAIKDVFEDTRVVLEPAGALAVAGAKAWVGRSGARARTRGAGATSRSSTTASPIRTTRTFSWASKCARARTPRASCAACAAKDCARSTFPTTRWRRRTCGTWSEDERPLQGTSFCIVSSSRSGRARCCAFSKACAATGTSVSSTTATRAPTTAACSSACRCRGPSLASSGVSSGSSATRTPTRRAIPLTSSFCCKKKKNRALTPIFFRISSLVLLRRRSRPAKRARSAHPRTGALRGRRGLPGRGDRRRVP